MAKTNNVKVKEVKLTLGGVERILRYDFNAFIALEEKFGTIDEALKALDNKNGGLSLKSARTFIWAGLVHEDENLTEMEVGKMISGIDELNELAEKMNEALNGSLPDAKDKKEVKND